MRARPSCCQAGSTCVNSRVRSHEIPAVRNLGYVRTADQILLISPANRIVVGEIPIKARRSSHHFDSVTIAANSVCSLSPEGRG